MTKESKKISFIIDHIDPMGQGVAKNNGEITFIPKTLPGETGQAIIYKKSKGVNFAHLTKDSLLKSSPQRIEPTCPHYSYCQGCHYLHCDHKTELEFKKQNLTRLLFAHSPHSSDSPQSTINQEIELITNSDSDSDSDCTRFHYRNRIQLHYDVKKKQIGFINKITKQIHSVKDCQLPDKKISDFLKTWYPNWIKEARGQKPRGHVEILLKAQNQNQNQNQIEVHWNQRYSSGGFTQVNAKMNQKMLKIVTDLGTALAPTAILDLFGGNGNLTNQMLEQTQAQRVAVDLYPHLSPNQSDQEFFTLDLDQEDALSTFCSHNTIKPDLLIIDPPRKGFKYIAQWCQHFLPKNIIYVSCNPATLARDLKELPDYFIDKTFLLDMFPGTYHYESIVLLKRASN